MVKKDVEDIYNVLKEVKNADTKKKIAQMINIHVQYSFSIIYP